MAFIPVNTPLLDGNEKQYLNECIETGWISSEGPFVSRFEDKLASKVGRKFGIAVSSGTAALDIAVKALGIGKNDEVIVPTFTIISCVSAIVRAGGTPVLVDSDKFTWNMNVDQVESKITTKTRAIMVVHIYGLPVDMNPLITLAKKYDLYLIEDAAEVIGQEYYGQPCGSFGDISIFSFYPNKHLTTGEGGMVFTNDQDLVERCTSLRNLCFKKNKRFEHDELGWNYRMTNIQAAIGLAQLERLDEFIERKRHIGRYYNTALSTIQKARLPLPETTYAENIYWVYGLVLNDEAPFNADELSSRLADKGIGNRPFFWPMHEQPVFRKMGLFSGESFPVAEKLARRGLYIPSGLALTEEQLERVCQSVTGILS